MTAPDPLDIIGPYHAKYPAGIAMIRDHVAAIVVDFGRDIEAQPGTGSPDESYHRVGVGIGGDQATLEWGKVGNCAIGRLTATAPTTVTVRFPRKTWHPFNAIYTATEAGMNATCVSADGRFLPWTIRFDVPIEAAANYEPSAEATIDLTPDQPVHFAAGFDQLICLSEVDRLLDRAGADYAAARISATSPWGDFPAAVADTMNSLKTYSSLDDRTAHIVSRRWAREDPDYAPYFGWDSFFNAMLAGIEDPTGARETIRAVLTYQRADGMVPNVAHWTMTRSGTMTLGNSQPPVGSMCLWRLHERWPDRDFLAEIYPRLVAWHDWWPAASDGNHDGLLEWGSDTGLFQEARFGCGADDSPGFDGIAMIGSQMAASAVDLNALWSMDAGYLTKIATELGFAGDAARFAAERAAMDARIETHLWNEAEGVWCTRRWAADGGPDGEFITRLTPLNFYPLAGQIAPDHASRALEILTDPSRFWGDLLLPSVPYDDPVWPEQDYWKGHVWPPMNYLVFEGLRAHGNQADIAYLASRSMEMFMRNWTQYGQCCENYRSIDGDCGGDPRLAWGGLMTQMVLDVLVDASSGRPQPTALSGAFGPITIANLPVGGRRYTLTIDAAGTATFAR